MIRTKKSRQMTLELFAISGTTMRVINIALKGATVSFFPSLNLLGVKLGIYVEHEGLKIEVLQRARRQANYRQSPLSQNLI